jgi:phosphoglycolate phosphatase
VYRAAGIPRTRWEDANRLWRRYYGQCRPVLLPGARRVLRQLARGFVLGLVSSGDRDRVTAQLRRFGLSSLFAACVCSEDATRRKPHPEPLRVAISQLGLRPEACVYIGDSSEDIEMARRAGVHAIAVLGRYPTHRQVYAAHPDAVLQSIRELPTVLERHYRGL